MAIAIQAMLWFTAKAKNTSDDVTQEDILDYDKEIKEVLPDILGSLMVVSAMDTAASDTLTPLMGESYAVDGRIAAASREFRLSPEQSVKWIAELFHSEVLPLHSELAQRISGIAGLTALGDNLKKSVTPNEGGPQREMP